MDQHGEARSEIARLIEQIQVEYESAARGLSGFASGTASHDFIAARMKRMSQLHETLFDLVGEENAIGLVDHALENCP